MFDYLLNWGVKNHQVNWEELDINDRMALQDQINNVRKKWSELMTLMDDVQGRLLDVNARISSRTKELIADNVGTSRNALLSQDDEYCAMEAERDALKTGISMIQGQIDFYRNDLRILNSVFYNKF